MVVVWHEKREESEPPAPKSRNTTIRSNLVLLGGVRVAGIVVLAQFRAQNNGPSVAGYDNYRCGSTPGPKTYIFAMYSPQKSQNIHICDVFAPKEPKYIHLRCFRPKIAKIYIFAMFSPK